MISDELRLSSQVEYVTCKDSTKERGVLGLLSRNFKRCSSVPRETTYFSMVRPILDYASTIWDPTKKVHTMNWSGTT